MGVLEDNENNTLKVGEGQDSLIVGLVLKTHPKTLNLL